MCPLCAGQDHIRGGWQSGSRRRQAHLNALMSRKMHTGTPMFSAAPISPEERSRTNLERMQQHAHLARHGSRATIPLALLAQRTGTTTADAGSIHDTQAAIGFSALLMRDQLLVGRTPQRPIRLEHKVLAGETAAFQGRPT